MSFDLKNLIAILSVFVLCISLCSCKSGEQAQNDQSVTSTPSSVTAVGLDETEMFTDRDKEIGYDENNSCKIVFSEGVAMASDNTVVINGATATIISEGTYVISGDVSDGQLVVEVGGEDKVQLVLAGVSISNPSSAAIYIKSADKVFITLAKDTVNNLSTVGSFVSDGDINVDGVIFSKADLTVNGEGVLNISTSYGHGIVSKDDLVFTGGNYNVTASNHALSGKDSVRVADGSFNLTATKDGIHSENTEDTEKGFIYISGGSFTVTADGDGIDASGKVMITAATLNVTAGGGYENAENFSNQYGGFGRFEGNFGSSADDSTASTKGIKADGDVTVSGGSFNINTADDAVHSNTNVLIENGTFVINTGDDAFHADSNLSVSGGDITVNQSYEGFEGFTIDVSGGNIYIKSSDDGFNAAGGNDESGYGGMMRPDQFSSTEGCYITVSGGTVTVNAAGDGIDSNGDLYITGGETYVWGPTNSGNGPLDYAGSAQASGGIFVAVGASGMAQNFSNASQGTMLISISGSAGSKLAVTDDEDNIIVSCTPEKSYQCAVISAPGILEGETYSVSAGSVNTEVEMESLLYGSSGGMGGMGPGGNMGGGHGGRPR